MMIHPDFFVLCFHGQNKGKFEIIIRFIHIKFNQSKEKNRLYIIPHIRNKQSKHTNEKDTKFDVL